MTSIIGLWRAGRGRKSAVATIVPLVEQSRHRLHGIADAAWLAPYMVGFTVMLITLIAKRRISALDPQELGLVQREAWAEITGLKAELIGEEVLYLSATGHGEFAAGCRNAVAFDEALSHVSPNGEQGQLEYFVGAEKTLTPFRERSEEQEAILEDPGIALLWRQYFDEHLRESPIGERGR